MKQIKVNSFEHNLLKIIKKLFFSKDCFNSKTLGLNTYYYNWFITTNRSFGSADWQVTIMRFSCLMLSLRVWGVHQSTFQTYPLSTTIKFSCNLLKSIPKLTNHKCYIFRASRDIDSCSPTRVLAWARWTDPHNPG